MARDPKDYKWSSYRFKVGERESHVLLDCDPLYIELGKDDAERQKEYEKWFKESVPPEEWDIIRKAVNKGTVFGNIQFKKKLEKLLGRNLDGRNRGRPRKG